jgi:hypothetical protein
LINMIYIIENGKHIGMGNARRKCFWLVLPIKICLPSDLNKNEKMSQNRCINEKYNIFYSMHICRECTRNSILSTK